VRERRFKQIDEFDHRGAAVHDADLSASGKGRVPRDGERAVSDDEDANLRPR
jgi:hypothetical protein